MNIEAEKEKICLNRIIGQKTEIVMIEGDVIIPDIKPDIVNTINTSGNICIYKKELLDGRARIDGNVQVHIIYLSDDTNNCIRGLNTCLDFTQIIDIEKCNSNMNLDLNINLKSIECKILNGRKVNVKATLEFKVNVSSNEDIEILKELKEIDNIQKLNKCLNVNSLVGKGNSKTYAKETLILENIDNLAEILKVDFKIINKDIKISYNKILAKADADVSIMYLTEDNRINIVQGNIPIMGFVDVLNVSENNLCDMKYELKNLIIKPNSLQEHSIYVESEIDLSCFVYESKEIEIIEDLYSPEFDILFQTRNVDAMTEMKKIKETCNIRNQINIPEISGNKIYNVSINPIINNTSIANDKIIYEGELNLKILFSSNNVTGIDIKTHTIPFNFDININGINITNKIKTEIEIKTQNFIVMSDGNIESRIDLEFNVDISKNTEVNIINTIELEENKNENNSSAIIYVVKHKDSLWNIAKKFNSTIDDIKKVNNLENENAINQGQQLCIPRYINNKKKVV